MKKTKNYIPTIIIFITIVCTCTKCEIDPSWPISKYYIENTTDDTLVCQYHYSRYDTCGVNCISIASKETKILHYTNEQDTLDISYTFEDMLFMSTQGDTLLYFNPVPDSIWTIEDRYADSESLWGYRLKYQFYKQ